MWMWMLCFLKFFSHKPISYSTTMELNGGRLNIWMVLSHKLQGLIVIALFG